MATVIGVAEFLQKVTQLKKKEDKIAALKHNDSYVLKTVLQGAFDPRIKWRLPEGPVPYTPNKLVDQENVFIRDCRLLKHFVDGGSPGLTQMKCEAMYIEMLEHVAPADAELMIALKDKKLPWKGITAELVREAFPDLLPPPDKKDQTASLNEQV
jgi:hypothetical protein